MVQRCDIDMTEEKLIEIKQLSEREVWVGKSRYYLGEENIIYVTAVGDIDEKAAMAASKFLDKFLEMIEGKVLVIIDLNKAGHQSSEARNIWKKRTEKESTGKVAFFGMHQVARVIASFVMGISRNKQMRFFKSKEEALTWLKEGQ